jgi:hypothetical protein
VKRLTREQAALIGLYTGTNCGPFGDMLPLASRILGRPAKAEDVHDFRTNMELRERLKPEFLAICAVE